MAFVSVKVYPQNTTDQESTLPSLAVIVDETTGKVMMVDAFREQDASYERVVGLTVDDFPDYPYALKSIDRSDTSALIRSALRNYCHPTSAPIRHETFSEVLEYYYPLLARKS